VTSASVELRGIDGANPLGFLAALGTLVTARAAGQKDARLLWRRAGAWVPVLNALSVTEPATLSEKLAEELRGREVALDAEKRREAAQRALDAVNTSITKKRADIRRRALTRDEKRAVIEVEVAPLERERDRKRTEWLAALKDAVPRPELALGKRLNCTVEEYREYATRFLGQATCATRESLDFFGAFGNDACVKKKNNQESAEIEPTPFCFTTGGGHQNFLECARRLINKVSAERVQGTLFKPWSYRDPGLSMRWDPVEDKRYALTDLKPADEGASTVWMANLLAYRGLMLFPCAPTRSGLATTAWSLPNEEIFTWPIWEFPASPDTIRSLLQLHELTRPMPDRAALRARGLAEVFRAGRIRFPPAGSNYKLSFTKSRRVG
jgi:hypothetical protein